MRMLDELRKDGESLFDRASANFAANAAEHLEKIRAAAGAGDAADLTATAHRLKGSATNLGLPALGEAAGALEALGDRGDLDGAEAGRLLAEVERELDHALAALDTLRVRGLGAGPGNPSY
jgi:HPt (histidine-containing phosphotransfer) domain-containing protein